MKREDVHAAWAPEGGAWSSWVKPVLFGSLPDDVEPDFELPEGVWPTAELLRPLGALTDVAAVVDLPQADGVWTGVALGAHGLRPIPLYNALPHEDGFVDLYPIREALVDACGRVATLSPGAPPAFLLDTLRLTERRLTGAKQPYDNRSIVRATDFPSAASLLSHGLRRILLIQGTTKRHQLDLEPILLAWQSGGLELWRLVATNSQPAAPYQFSRLPWYDRLSEWLSRPSPRPRSDGAYGKLWIQHSG